jgi:transposase InsO family protein
MKILMRPWAMIGVDIIGPLPLTNRGNRYILTVCDYYTRYSEVFALPDIETDTVVQHLVDGIICRYGVFDILVSDRGSSFVSALAEAVYTELGIKHHKASAYHPAANGLVERFNQNFNNVLKRWVAENRGDWDDLLPRARFANNSMHQGMHELTPSYACHGFEPRTILDALLPNVARDDTNVYNEYAQDLAGRMREVHKRIKQLYNEEQEQRVERPDQGTLPVYQAGDRVMVYDPTHKKGEPSTFKKRWTGPSPSYVPLQKLPGR